MKLDSKLTNITSLRCHVVYYCHAGLLLACDIYPGGIGFQKV